MINRDFSKSAKEYIKQNKFVLIAVAIIIAVGIVMLSVFGFKGGSEIKGYNTFSVTMGTTYDAGELEDYTQSIKACIAKYDGDLQSVQLTGEGDYTTLVVKYSGSIKKAYELNAEIANELKISVLKISEHSHVEASLTSKDYVYTIAGGLIILTLAVMYIAFRHNIACAVSALASSILGIILLMAITAIFRLSINSSFLAINIITMLLILAESFMLFDGINKERENDKSDRSAQLLNTLKANAFRQKIMYGALFAMALIFVILMPNTIKQASLIALFAIVVALFVTIYALPLLWCLTITRVSDKIRLKKVEKVKAVQTADEVEGELEQNYTENQVIEVKEDAGDETPSSDDNITIE